MRHMDTRDSWRFWGVKQSAPDAANKANTAIAGVREFHSLSPPLEKHSHGFIQPLTHIEVLVANAYKPATYIALIQPTPLPCYKKVN